MTGIYKNIKKSPPLQRLLELLQARKSKVHIDGLAGSLGSFLTAAVFEDSKASLLLIAASPSEAEAALDDLVSILGSENVGFLPSNHQYRFRKGLQASGPRNERTEAMMRIGSGTPTVLVTQPEVLLEGVPDRTWIDDHKVKLRIGDEYPREKLIETLFKAEYQRESLIDSHGQYSVRGGLIDVFPFGHENPVRIEYDDDLVEDLRLFDPVTQRSIKQIEETAFLPCEESGGTNGGILDLIPKDTIIFWDDLDGIEERIDIFLERYNGSHNTNNTGTDSPSALAYTSLTDVLSEAHRFRQIIWEGLTHRFDVQIDFRARSLDPFPLGLDELPVHLRKYLDDDVTVWIAADREGERARLDELLSEYELDTITTLTPSFSSGFTTQEVGVVLLNSHELFNRRRLRTGHTRFRSRVAPFERTSVQKGDLIVHTEFGIGMYEGLQTVKVRNQPRECLRIRYQDDIILYVRVENFGLVEKYVGSGSIQPQLSRLGGTEWTRTKKRTRKALQDMAAELIKLYAQRKIVKGIAYPSDTLWQQEMEASFEFDDTPDQITSTEDFKHDLEEPHPMDRLLCGDVGFGKTEIAIRAAFKIVQESRQVALLAPTTILVQQHLETFRARLGAYPVNIESLSRFRTKKEQQEIVKKLARGEVDIIIGTHRLLSRDVAFKKLGLMIVDEEHKFGVRHKEKLKQFKTNVDVLTLTATPIPRTLHLALMGARDTSLINTPPMDRLPVQTEVHGWSEELISEAILREIDRQGQVFFLHNRVQSIYSVEKMLERLVPGLRYCVAHGQMKGNELEKVISDFLRYRYDVLVTTMIIESGIDMPNVNTLIVNRADCFGLAQLYQLRGRIGRSSRQAYAYLLTPPRLSMTSKAKRRLGTIAELTDLGSGMKVALRDLEIRGAGNLLGAKQSGYINTIGFDLYSKILDEEASKIKDEQPDEKLSVNGEIHVEYSGPALFPTKYIDDSDVRYDFYRRLTGANDINEIDRIDEELLDRFGILPVSARNLLELARLKVLCRVAKIKRLSVEKDYLIASISLPDNPEESHNFIGRLVAAADPEKIEFRASEGVEILYRFNSEKQLQKARKFLQRITREGILQG
ncbi:MAG: transcription-repair coupling factor [Candidatus Hatepunaea meridiana]|nr:transcription-repair coupling factor [Candidatus Hatepunaea meridiana]